MKKLNKKGFTLIEMLVVIAIIAVLVGVAIPIVSNSTVKAKAATDAANLRSAEAVIAAKFLSDDSSLTYTNDTATVSASDCGVPAKAKTDESDFSGTVTKAGVVTVTYGGHDIDYFATMAETGAAPTNTGTGGEQGQQQN